MKHPVRLERHSGIAVISIDNPPVNAMSAAVRAGILAALNAAAGDDTVRAIVISARGRTFPAGADISEFGKPSQDPDLPTLCDLIEACDKPVIAAMHGTVLGGGLELAIACHYRVCDLHTTMGFPEIKLGLLPGAGGTQRGPRLIGAGPALDMCLSGTSIDAPDALELGLVDRVDDEGDLRAAALALAEAKIDKGPYRTSELRGHLHDGAGYMAAVNERRARIKDDAFAEHKILACIEAALLLPFAAGRQMERQAFLDCTQTRTSKGLRHSFFAERRATKFPQTGDARAIGSVAIIGGGLMGSGIAVACMNAGLPVTIVEETEDGVNAALDRIGAIYETGIKRGKMSETKATQALSQMTLTTKIEEIKGADLVIEAVTEDMDVKTAVLALISEHAGERAVIATNTSYFDVAELAKATGREADVVGLHFFAPANLMRLVEVIATPHSASDAVLGARAFAKRLGKLPVHVSGGVGFLGNRLLTRMRQVCDAMLEDGATPEQIDAAMRSFGLGLGPYQVIDRSGLDISWARRKAIGPPEGRHVKLADQMCLAGWFGRKSGRGYYVYDKDGVAVRPNADMLVMLSKLREENGITPRDFSTKNILDRVLLALVNEAALMMEEGIVNHPSDIDVVMVHGFGYPRARGGPLQDAANLTLFEVHRRVALLEAQDPTLWKVAPLLSVLAAERQSFAELNLN
jgi:3-hydroxyacyl-CoA dehydrogenase